MYRLWFDLILFAFLCSTRKFHAEGETVWIEVGAVANTILVTL